MKPHDNVDRKFALGFIAFYLTLLFVGGYGWIMNLITIWHTMDSPVTAKFIARVAGIFVFPVGAVLGFL